MMKNTSIGTLMPFTHILASQRWRSICCGLCYYGRAGLIVALTGRAGQGIAAWLVKPPLPGLVPMCRTWQTAVPPGAIVDVAIEATEAVAEDPGDRAERRTMRRSGCPAPSLGDSCSRWVAETDQDVRLVLQVKVNFLPAYIETRSPTAARICICKDNNLFNTACCRERSKVWSRSSCSPSP